MSPDDNEAIAGVEAAESLAVAWQPRPTRQAFAALLAFDARLRRQVARAREPLIGQIGLAWWRERLAEGTSDDPLLALLAETWGAQARDLVPLVDGWEELLEEAPLSDDAIEGFATGRAASMAAFVRLAGYAGAAEAAMLAGRRWALAEFAFRTGDPDEKRRALRLGEHLAPPQNLPRSLRGLAVLDGLSARSLARGEPLFAGRGAALAVLRLGMFGA